jgi:DNA polymerase-3 subunit epsilon
VIKQEFNLRCQPFDYEAIEQAALDVTGNTIEGLKAQQSPQAMYKQFVGILSRYVNKFDKNDKMYVAGYNVRFDIDFLRMFFVKNKDPYFGSWINYKSIDGLAIMYMLEYCGHCKLENYKLGTVCSHYKIDIDAHDALSDIKATYTLIKRMKAGFEKGMLGVTL